MLTTPSFGALQGQTKCSWVGYEMFWSFSFIFTPAGQSAKYSTLKILKVQGFAIHDVTCKSRRNPYLTAKESCNLHLRYFATQVVRFGSLCSEVAGKSWPTWFSADRDDLWWYQPWFTGCGAAWSPSACPQWFGTRLHRLHRQSWLHSWARLSKATNLSLQWNGYRILQKHCYRVYRVSGELLCWRLRLNRWSRP